MLPLAIVRSRRGHVLIVLPFLLLTGFLLFHLTLAELQLAQKKMRDQFAADAEARATGPADPAPPPAHRESAP